MRLRVRQALAALILILLMTLLAAEPVRSSGRTQTDTKILSEQLSSIFVLPPPFLGGKGALRSPLVVFYEPGFQTVASDGSLVGFVVSPNDAATIVVTGCPDVEQSPAIGAACLQPAGVEEVGTYQGVARMLPESRSEDAASQGAVRITLISQQNGLVFVIFAALGIVISLAATWFVGEYQQIRKLREACAEFTGNEPLGCPDNEGSLTLKGLGSLFDAVQLEQLQENGFVLFGQSLIGRRPDYESLNQSLNAAREAAADFASLCRLSVQLEEDQLAIDILFAEIGGQAEAALSGVIQEQFAPGEGHLQAAQVATRLVRWKVLHVLAQRWHNTAGHVRALCLRYEQLTGQSCASGPQSNDGNEAALFIATARNKLAVLNDTADFAVLNPAEDIQHAWLLLEQLAGPTSQPSFSDASMTAEAKGFMEISFLPDFSEVVRDLRRTWTPRLNTAMIIVLLIVSYAATLLLGAQTLYIGKPWGTFADIVFLLLLGGGVYTGLAGLAVLIAPNSST